MANLLLGFEMKNGTFFNKRNNMLILLLVCYLFPFVVNSYWIMSLIIPGLIFAVACMGWNNVQSVGQTSLGQAGFMTIGGYGAVLFALNFNLPVWITVPVGGLLSAMVALLVGSIVLRLGGFYFSIVTLSFGEIVRVTAMNWTDLTGGAYGLLPPAPVIDIFGYQINFAINNTPYYLIALTLVVCCGLFYHRFDASRTGGEFKAIAENPILSAHLGMRLMRYRVASFTVAGFFTGMAGALYSYYLFIIEPRMFSMPQSFMILIMCVVGGVKSPVAGPIIGALLLSATGDYLTTIFPGGKVLLFGFLVVLSTFFLPDGLVGLKSKLGMLKVGGETAEIRALPSTKRGG